MSGEVRQVDLLTAERRWGGMTQAWDPTAVVAKAGRLKTAWYLGVGAGVGTFALGFFLAELLTADRPSDIGLIALIGMASAACSFVYLALCHAVAPELRATVIRDAYSPARPASGEAAPQTESTATGEGIEVDPVACGPAQLHRSTHYRRTGDAQVDVYIARYVRARRIIDLLRRGE